MSEEEKCNRILNILLDSTNFFLQFKALLWFNLGAGNYTLDSRSLTPALLPAEKWTKGQLWVEIKIVS